MKTRKRLTQAERRDRTRRALLEAAAATFAARGYHGAGVEEIAATAGVTKGALYYNFAGKEDLFLALLDQHVGARVALLEELRGSGREALREGARRMAGALRAQREWSLLFLEFSAEAARDARVRRRLGAGMRPFRAALREMAGSLAGPRADAVRLASAVEALIDGYALAALVRPEVDVGRELADALEALFPY